ncbi:MAG: hypothetical protein Q9228_001721 [Teloschistes exilis]
MDHNRPNTQLSDFIVRLRREYSGDKDAEKIITTFEGLFSQDTLEKYMNRIHDVYKDLGRSPARPLKPTAQKDYYDEHTVRNLISQIESAGTARARRVLSVVVPPAGSGIPQISRSHEERSYLSGRSTYSNDMRQEESSQKKP